MGFGDELMVAGRARAMQESDPRRVRVVKSTRPWHEAWENNPRIARPEENGDFQVLVARDEKNLRPYMVEKTGAQWTWREYCPPRGELYFTEQERDFGARHAGRVIVEPHIKPGASPNKDWGWMRWGKLVWLMNKARIRPLQLGPPGTRVIEGADFVVTSSMRLASAVMARARAAVVHEGGMHHVAAAVGTPAVVIFGGFIAPSVTGYPDQFSFFTGGDLGCGMRVRCQHCVEAMAKIEPGEVFRKFEAIIDTAPRHLAA